MILPRPSVTPLWSFASMPVRRSPSTVEMVRAIWSWCRGLTRREGLAEEIEEERPTGGQTQGRQVEGIMSADLLALAAKYVALTEEIEDVRRAMLACLTNGAGEHPARPTQPARSAGGSKHPNAAKAEEIESQILEMLRTRPMRMAEIAAETGARQTTTAERLRRMRGKGLVERQHGARPCGGRQAPRPFDLRPGLPT